MMKLIAFSKQALRTLARLPTNEARGIRAKLDQYAADPAAQAANVKALKGAPGVIGLRVGDWRVLFAEDGTVIAVIRVAPKGIAYD